MPKFYDGPERYRFQSWYVRAARWLRWKPLAYVCAALDVLRWVLNGLPTDKVAFEDGEVIHFSRRDELRHILMSQQSAASYRMGDWFTIEECIDVARERR